MYVYDFLDITQRVVITPDHGSLLDWLNLLCRHYSDGRASELATVTSIDRSNLVRWLEGNAKPSLDLLIHFCVSLRCSPASIITKQPSLIDHQLIRRASRPPMSKRKARTPDELQRIRVELSRVLQKKVSPPSLKQLSRSLGCTPYFLTSRFPELATPIRDRARKHRATLTANRRQI
jgi:transcriptional regulator with XRE-family HTH domain